MLKRVAMFNGERQSRGGRLGQPPADREPLSPQQAGSSRQERECLRQIDSDIGRLSNRIDNPDDGPAALSEREADRRNALRARRGRLEEEKRRILFGQLSKAEQEQWIKNALAMVESLKPISVIAAKAGLPRGILEARVSARNEQKMLPLMEQTRIAFEATAKEAVECGLSGLWKTLTAIHAATSTLPGSILYLDTCARPLRYATTPLLCAVYKAHGEHLPVEAFIKTYSRYTTAADVDSELERHNSEAIQPVRDALARLAGERQEVIRMIKKYSHGSAARGELSDRAHALDRERAALRQELAQKRDALAWVSSGKHMSVVEQRVQKTLARARNDIILVVDDVVSTGRSFGQLAKTFAALGTISVDKVFYFPHSIYKCNSVDKKIN